MMTRKVIALSLAPVLGILAMIAPVLLWPPARLHEASLFPLLATALEGVGLPQLVLLFGVGLLLGVIWTGRAWVIGLVAIVGFPAAALAEMVKDPESHNLFPIEFAIYGFYGLIVAGGAALIHFVRRSLANHRKAGERVP